MLSTLRQANLNAPGIFDGDRDLFSQLQSSLETAMAAVPISYLWNPAEMARMVIAPADPALIEDGPAWRRDTANQRSFAIYTAACELCTKNITKINKDFSQAIGILGGLCSFKINRDLDVFVNPALDRPNRAKFMAAWDYLVSTYGPTDQTDVDKIKAQLRAANPNTSGFADLVSTHTECNATLIKVKKYHPDRTPKLDAAGNHMDYSHTQDELRTILMEQLALTDRPAFAALRSDAVRDQTMSYQAIMIEIRQLLKDAALYDPKSLPRPGNTMLAAPAVNTTYSSQHQLTHRNSNCRNCNGSHSVWDCTDNRCHECRIRFNTPEERKQHAYEVHSRSNKGNNNSNNNNNYQQGYSNSNSRSNNYNNKSHSRGNSRSRNSSSYRSSNNNGDRSSRSRSRSRGNNNEYRSTSDRSSTPRFNLGGDRSRSRSRSNGRSNSNTVSFRAANSAISSCSSNQQYNGGAQQYTPVSAYLAAQSNEALDHLQDALRAHRLNRGSNDGSVGRKTN